jgi:hypothetical protein
VKLFVAVPAWDGRLYTETVRSLLNEQAAAVSVGDQIQFSFLSGCGCINQVRNQLVADFEASDADKMVFLDADVSWEFGHLLRLAHHPVNLVGGAYRLRKEPEEYPVIWLDRRELWTDKNGLLEVASLPAGFLAISRNAFSAFRKHYGDRRYINQGKEYYAYFHSPFTDKCLFGEDVRFCFEWRAMGGNVYLDPELTLGHVDGSKSYKGCIGTWLKSRTLEAVHA